MARYHTSGAPRPRASMPAFRATREARKTWKRVVTKPMEASGLSCWSMMALLKAKPR